MSTHHNYYENILTVKNAQRNDTGQYLCDVTDHSGNSARAAYSMLVLNINETYIELVEPNNYTNIHINAKKPIMLTVHYNGYPLPRVDWYKEDGSKLIPGLHKKYDVINMDIRSTLKIAEAHLLDSGFYTATATNGAESKSIQFTVTVADKPIVMMKDAYVHVGQKAHLMCHVKSHTQPDVVWKFQPCSIEPRWPSCTNEHIRNFNVSLLE